MAAGKTHGEGSFSQTAEVAEKKHSIIAKYEFTDTLNKDLASALRHELFLERIHVLVKYKYIFYSPSYYSDEYYINDAVFISSRITNRDSTWINQYEKYVGYHFIIKEENDTLFGGGGGLSPLKSIPETLKVYSNANYIGDYHLKYIYQENLKSIPNDFGPKNFSLGALFDESYDGD